MITKNIFVNGVDSPFTIWKPKGKNPKVDYRTKKGNRGEKSLIITLLICLTIIFCFRDYRVRLAKKEPGHLFAVYSEIIPATYNKTTKPPPPDRPAVPVEAEFEEMAEDVTIDFEEIAFSKLPPIPG